MELSNLDQVIQFAIAREEDAIEGYGKMAEMAKTPGLQKFCLELQEEEKNHKKLLQDVSGEKIESLKMQKVTDLKISDYLIEEPLSAEMTFQDLLIFAAKKEQRAVDLYSIMKEKVETEELKKLFEFLIQQEKSHKLKLEEEYEKHVLEWN